MKILVLHGPNLNRLGSRELEVYGPGTLAELDEAIGKTAAELGIEVEIHNSGHEGVLIDLLHQGADRVDGAVVNPAALAHTSRALADAIRSVPYPVIEVHLSNIHAREPWRRRSVTAEAALGIVAGLGHASYLVALRALAERGAT